MKKPGIKGFFAEAARNTRPVDNSSHFFLALAITYKMIPITSAIKIKAHHIPALKIVSIAPQLLNTKLSKRRDSNSESFMIAVFLYKTEIQVSYQRKKIGVVENNTDIFLE